MILYYPTKISFNTMNSFRVIGRGHFPTPLPRAQAPQKKTVPDRVKIRVQLLITKKLSKSKKYFLGESS